jgi:hypothetical protein
MGTSIEFARLAHNLAEPKSRAASELSFFYLSSSTRNIHDLCSRRISGAILGESDCKAN